MALKAAAFTALAPPRDLPASGPAALRLSTATAAADLGGFGGGGGFRGGGGAPSPADTPAATAERIITAAVAASRPGVDSLDSGP
jgi:hypothetical protein